MKKGDYKVQCDLSGFLVPASRCRRMWNGLFVLKELWRPRHPQDHSVSIKETSRPANARPEGAESFIAATDVTSADL